MSLSAPTAPLELVDGELFRLGGVEEIDGRISWVPRSASGFEPINCYLLLEGSSALLVDTGVAAHATEVLAQLDQLVGDRELSLFLTRFEPDCLTNMDAIQSRFELKAVYGGGIHNPFDFFDDISPQDHIRHDHQIELIRKRPGETVPVGPGRSLEVLSTNLRVLTSFWAYEPQTRTLFTSDSFGHARLQSAEDPPVVRSGDPISLDEVRDTMFAKMDWVQYADTARLEKDLMQIFAPRPIEVIAPAHGCPIVGAEATEEHIGLVFEVLREVQRGTKS